MTQSERILDYIQKHGSIDPWRAMNDLHIMRLASRIYDLKKMGVDIVGTIRSREIESGTVKWMEYRIREPLGAANTERLKGGDDSRSRPSENITEE